MNNSWVYARCLLDTGSQISLINKTLFEKLNLKTFEIELNILGVSESAITTKNSAFVEMHSLVFNYNINVKCAIVEKINSFPQGGIEILRKIKFPENITLADNSFGCSGGIELLLSADICFQVLLNGIIKLENGLILQNTLFGHVVSGCLLPSTLCHNFLLSCHLTSYDNFEGLISKFWEIKKVPEIYPEFSTEQKAYQELFCKSVKLIDKKF